MKKNVFFILLKIAMWLTFLGAVLGFILFAVVGVFNITQHEIWEGIKTFANALTDLMFAGLMGVCLSITYTPDEEDGCIEE